jgi:WD repeat-containing protein 23
MSTGTCTVHSWNDGAEEDEAKPKMGLRVNPKLDMDPSFYASPPRAQPIRRNLRGLRGLRAVITRGADDDDDDDELGFNDTVAVW